MWPSFKAQRAFAVPLFILFILLILFFAAKTIQVVFEAKQVGKPTPYEHTIMIDAEGKVVATPDIAQLSLGVETRATDVPTAQEKNTQTMNTIIEGIKELNITEEDIQTASYTVYQEDYWDPETQRSKKGDWIVSQQLMVKIREMKNISSVLQLAGQKGVTNISGPTFSIDDLTNLKDQAREKGLEEAKEKAQQIAGKLGLKLGKIIGYSEWYDNSVGPIYYEKSAAIGMGGGESAPTIPTGTKEVKLNVNVTYLLEE
ncbi:hypothetical protein CO172_01525 [Candidatus Uhrbacteria bacterium CG_4_9_14_3_um_filter_36_7]|uniref:SIMPL domain-containing protein n=1 Tax=Candidatus Uhrbacteria bacterium CG_4_9_14_3_um_filter_36_7 TaxID=1975033 RepID=A0A2M7XHS7_9BACT|nr:MAG: hypothetical protein CO172_01525 [Candidatus Uhrbacteria bacterium CG_4_9_14_3_um_filter_36_7]